MTACSWHPVLRWLTRPGACAAASSLTCSRPPVRSRPVWRPLIAVPHLCKIRSCKTPLHLPRGLVYGAGLRTSDSSPSGGVGVSERAGEGAGQAGRPPRGLSPALCQSLLLRNCADGRKGRAPLPAACLASEAAPPGVRLLPSRGPCAPAKLAEGLSVT